MDFSSFNNMQHDHFNNGFSSSSDSQYDSCSSSPGWSRDNSMMPATPEYVGQHIDVGDLKWFPAAEHYQGSTGPAPDFDCFSDHAMWPMSPPPSQAGPSTWQQPILPSNGHIHAQPESITVPLVMWRSPPTFSHSFGPISDVSSFSSSIGNLGMPSSGHNNSSSPGCPTTVSQDLDNLAISPRPRRQRKVKTERPSKFHHYNGIYIPVTVDGKKTFPCGAKHPDTKVECQKFFSRPEHCKRHRKACHVARAQAEHNGEEDNTPPPRCLLHGCNSDWCKPKGTDPRCDNLLQHYSTHCKDGRNKCVDPDFLYFLIGLDYKLSGIDPSKADSVMKSVVNGVIREVRKQLKEGKAVKEGTHNMEMMLSHPLYSQYRQQRAAGMLDLHWDADIKAIFAAARQQQKGRCTSDSSRRHNRHNRRTVPRARMSKL